MFARCAVSDAGRFGRCGDRVWRTDRRVSPAGRSVNAFLAEPFEQPALLPRGHVPLHRRFGRLRTHSPDGFLGLAAFDREGHSSTTYREHSRVDDDVRDGTRAGRLRAAAERLSRSRPSHRAGPVHLDRRCRAGRGGCDLRRKPRVRTWVQRGDRRRQSRVARFGDRRHAW